MNVDANDARLVDRCLEGDRAAFDVLVLQHRGAVMAVARRLLRSPADAEDAAQETFVRAWRSLRSWRRDAPLRAWLLTIAVNACRTRGARLRPDEPVDGAPEPVDPRPRADGALEEGEARRVVRLAVAALPPRQREVVLLKVFSGMTHEDVAGAMGLTVGAVKAHLHQAVANLRRRLTTSKGGSR
ncbi:MAG TPA: RNA polymerase sigma factor [Candidatus Polarisedimenticolaceae bacterium]